MLFQIVDEWFLQPAQGDSCSMFWPAYLYADRSIRGKAGKRLACSIFNSRPTVIKVDSARAMPETLLESLVHVAAAAAGYSCSKSPAATTSTQGPLVHEDEDTPLQYRPNFVKFVLSSAGKHYAHFLPNVSNKAALEEAAIRLYSGNTVYARMNQALRDDDVDGLWEYGGLIKLTMQPFGFDAMQSQGSVLKPYVGIVWRGCRLSSSVLSKYQVGQMVIWEGFSSTSSAKKSAFGGNVAFEIHCNKALEALKLKPGGEVSLDGEVHESHPTSSTSAGPHVKNDFFVPAQIHHLSQYPNENEVLYPPYTKFRIVSRVNGIQTCIVLETMEFPSLCLLAKEGNWNEVKKGMEAREGQSNKAEAWFVKHSDLANSIASKVVNEGAASDGLSLIAQMQAWGTDVSMAHEQLMAAGLDSAVPLPPGHPKWYFDAGILNADDKQLSTRLRIQDGCQWQQYFARQATLLENWYEHGRQGQAKYTVINNIGVHVPYVVFATASGEMYQKAVGGGMIGNLRRVWRAA